MLTFGTDGVRGVANVDLTPTFVEALGRAAARVLPASRYAVGRDTRRSGPELERALVSGLRGEGAAVEVLGVAPTPAVAWVAAAERIAGAVISASHNPYQDNGIKVFASGGAKLSDAEEAALEAELRRLLTDDADDVRPAPTPGPVLSAEDQVARWEASVVASVEGRRFDGLRVVVDCANGAASEPGPRVLRALGAEVEVLHASPNGTNINAECGSTHPHDVVEAVLRTQADVGVAFDGDADRVLAVDAGGRLIDGDQIIAVTAIDRRDRRRLPHDTVVVTVMTNLGFRLGMADHGIHVEEVPVGDRHVLQAMAAGGFSLGGEQSGHVVFGDLATTGDGLLTAVQLLDVVARSGRDLASLADAAMTRLPQVLRNVRVERRDLDVAELVAAEVASIEAELGGRGRVLIRASGTEPLVRVMVEAPSAEVADAAAARLAAAVEALTPQ